MELESVAVKSFNQRVEQVENERENNGRLDPVLLY